WFSRRSHHTHSRHIPVCHPPVSTSPAGLCHPGPTRCLLRRLDCIPPPFVRFPVHTLCTPEDADTYSVLACASAGSVATLRAPPDGTRPTLQSPSRNWLHSISLTTQSSTAWAGYIACLWPSADPSVCAAGRTHSLCHTPPLLH